ncbi:septal ring lytic transglycosylase RlpA family protein [bacterium]|nr:septal ring lytic transglycosylase RlpA family protein [bacterium]
MTSWHGPGFYGRRTANGERLRKGALTAVHHTLPFETIVGVINLDNGRSVNVRINHRGSFKYHRVIDLAHGTASELNMMRAGEIHVSLEVID